MLYYPNLDEAHETSLQPGDEIWITFSGDVTILRKKTPLVLIEDEGSSASVTMYNPVRGGGQVPRTLATVFAQQLAAISGLKINPEPKVQETGVPQYIFEVISR